MSVLFYVLQLERTSLNTKKLYRMSEKNWPELARVIEIVDLLTLEQLNLLIQKATYWKEKREERLRNE